MPRTTPAPDAPGAGVALPRPPGALRRWIDRHPRATDILVAVFTQALPFPLMGFTVVDLLHPWASVGLMLTAGIATAAVLFTLTLFRRRIPFALLTAALLASFLPSPLGLLSMPALWVALYTIGAHRSSRYVWVSFAIASVVCAGTQLSYWVTQDEQDRPPEPGLWVGLAVLDSVFTVLFAALIPTFIGLWIGGRRRYERALIERAEDLARERDQRAKLAVSEERTRIAREMHDIVSHSLTVMITLSEGAAAQAETGTGWAPDAMRRVAETGRESLAERRRLLGVLRAPDSPGDLAPQPGADDIGSLIDGFRSAGMPPDVESRGCPGPPRRHRSHGLPHRAGVAHERAPARARHRPGRDRDARH